MNEEQNNVIPMEINQARVNITIAGENGDLRDPIFFDASDVDIKTWVTEAVANGSVPGIPANRNADFTDFVVDRFAANAERPYNLVQVRPKTPFGVDRNGVLRWCASVEKEFSPREEIPRGDKAREVPETFLACAIRYLRALASE
jgi:hypothetical protein